MGIYLYSQKAIDAYKKKRKRDAAKAKKTLEKLATSSPVLQALINKKASQIAWAMQKKAPKKKTFEPPPQYVFGMGKDFYRTREWREVRYKALVKYGKKCQCCGETGGYIHVDHIQPRSKMPELELQIENLQVLCEACNIGKSNKDSTDWR